MSEPLVFPVPSADFKSWEYGMGRFGHSRAGGARRHAGGDVYAKLGAEIVAMRPGRVTALSTEYYRDTGAVTVTHPDGSVFRYCEVRVPLSVRVGQEVEVGQVIAHVGDLKLKGIPQMLHFEAFSGQIDGKPATGPLTVGARESLLHPGTRKPYLRRKDLLDPTSILTDAWEARTFASGTPTLREGSTGEAVARLQAALKAAGDYKGRPDGVFGKVTTQAVKAYQTRRRLTADGIVGKGTWTALERDGL